MEGPFMKTRKIILLSLLVLFVVAPATFANSTSKLNSERFVVGIGGTGLDSPLSLGSVWVVLAWQPTMRGIKPMESWLLWWSHYHVSRAIRIFSKTHTGF